MQPAAPPAGQREPLRTGLRILLTALGAVALVAGLYTVLTGNGGMPGDSRASANVESELRFYSAFWAGFGALALYASRRPEREAALLRGLALFLFLGGVARVLAWLASSRPDSPYLVLMGLELTLPLFLVWAQSRVGSRA
ncbi:MAG TPA: DUF4345 domain-containing protein [Solirubrobacterales bacterium]